MMRNSQSQIVIDIAPGADDRQIAELLRNAVKSQLDIGLVSWQFKTGESVVYSEPLLKLRNRRPEMFRILEKAAEIQCSKGDEYAVEEDPFRNYRDAGNGQGTEGWRYAAGRLSEKVSRMGNMIRSGKFIADAEETMLDLVNMAGIVLNMIRRNE